MSEKSWLCATCLRAGAQAPAVTFVGGTALCADHATATPDDGAGVPRSHGVDLGGFDDGIQHHMK